MQNLHQGSDYASRSVELASQLTFLLSKFGQAIFIGAAQNVLAVAVLYHLNVGKQVYHIPQAALVQLRTGEVLGQDVLEALVLLFDGPHGLVNDCADLRRVGRCGDHAPPGILRHKEDVFGCVFVLVLLETVALVYQFLVLGLEAVGDVFQENQAKDDGFILRGVDIAPQHTGCVPDLFFKAKVACGFFSHSGNPPKYLLLFVSL